MYHSEDNLVFRGIAERQEPMRTLIVVIAGLCALVTGAAAVWSVGRTVSDLGDPCVMWSPPAIAQAPAGCRSVTVHGESKIRAAAVALLVPGGLLASIALCAVGFARRRRASVSIAAAVMFGESLVAFTLLPLTLATGLAFLGVAWGIPPERRATP